MNTATDTWSVRSTGKTVDELDESTVLENFAKTFDVSEEKAKSYLQQGKLIKKSLSETNALVYQRNLIQIGLQVIIADESANDDQIAEHAAPQDSKLNTASLATQNPPSSATSISNLTDDVPTPQNSTASALSIAPIDSSADTTVSSSESFSCPRCMLVQEKSAQCQGCSVYFEKIQSSDQANSLSSSRASARPSRHSVEDDDESAIPLISLGAAALVALICAYLWKFIAVQFGIELGVVAWAIGGAVGATAVVTGGRGTFVGATCAVLVVLSMFGGKYLYMSAFLNEAVAYMEEEVGEDWISDAYSELDSDREAFALIAKNEQSIKRFMIEHDYTDATTTAQITAEDYEIFTEEMQPWLEQYAEDGEYFAEGDSEPLELAAALGEFSVWSMVRESLGFMDLLFLFLAVSTAFRLGNSGFARS